MMETNNIISIFKKMSPEDSKALGPIEKKMRLMIESLKDCKYPDSFDWSVYDKLAARYEEEPRGGVVFNTTFKLVNFHSSCSKCHYSFEIDTYGRGCIHNCVYCYAKQLLNSHGYWNRPQPFPVNLAEVRKIFYTVFETQKPSKWRNILEQRIPLRLGSMSDCFMWMDQKYKITFELLKILKFYNYPYIIFTRSDLVAHDDYLDVIDPNLASIQFSMCGGNEALTRKIEPGAPGVTRRLIALKKLADEGYWTTVRLNPLFPTYPDGYYTDQNSIIERFGSLENAPKLELFDLSFIKQLKEAKVPSLLAGFVRLSPYAIRSMSKELGFDFGSFFKPEFKSSSSDNRYSDSEITFYYKKIQSECAKQGIRFNTCYIGNGIKDYYQHQDLWSNKQDCCDARGMVPAFKTSSQNILWEERLKHTPHKEDALRTKELENAMDSFDSKPTIFTASIKQESIEQHE